MMALLLLQDLLHQLTPGLADQPALLLVDGVADLGGLGDTELVSEGLAVRVEFCLTAGLNNHLTLSLVEAGAVLLVHSPTQWLTDRPAGLLVH